MDLSPTDAIDAAGSPQRFSGGTGQYPLRGAVSRLRWSCRPRVPEARWGLQIERSDNYLGTGAGYTADTFRFFVGDENALAQHAHYGTCAPAVPVVPSLVNLSRSRRLAF